MIIKQLKLDPCFITIYFNLHPCYVTYK